MAEDEAGAVPPATGEAASSSGPVPRGATEEEGDEGDERTPDIPVSAKVICQAAKEGDVEVLAYLLSSGKATVDACDDKGWQPLHFAAHSGHTEALRLLLAHKADVDARQGDGSVALHDAAYGGHADATRLLLDHKADVRSQDEDGWTALHFAAARGHGAVARLLLDHGADPAATAVDGKTPYTVAVAEGHTEVLELLGAPPPPSSSAPAGDGPGGQPTEEAADRIARLEAALARALTEKAALQDAFLKKNGAPPPPPAAEGAAAAAAAEDGKDADGRRRRKKKDRRKDPAAKADPHEDAAEALDSALQTFSANAESLESLIAAKQAEAVEAEGAEYGPEEAEVYVERMMELYSLKAEDVSLPPTRPNPLPGDVVLALEGEHHHLPVSCLLLLDVLYHPYFKDSIARQVSYVSTVTHPHLSLFIGLCFPRRPADVQAEARRSKKPPAPSVDGATGVEAPAPLPYADVATKDHEIGLVYEAFGVPLKDTLAGGPFTPGAVVRLLGGLAAALAHVHRRGHVHNCISSSTVRVERRTHSAKLSHFGVVGVANVLHRTRALRCPNRWYCAPESLVEPGGKRPPPPPVGALYDYGAPAHDVYALGMVLLAMCTGKEEGRPGDLAKGVKPPGLRDLAYLTTKARPEDRPTAAEVAATLRALQRLPDYAI